MCIYCHTILQDRDVGLQTSWSADMLASFNGSVTWSEALRQTSYTAELERRTTYSAGCEEHLHARMQREHQMTHAELQASRRFWPAVPHCMHENSHVRFRLTVLQ